MVRRMPFRRLIPCLDVTDGRVVKGVSFQGLRDVGDPVTLAAAYSDGGADELVFLDITATLHDVATMVDVVERVAAEVSIPFTVGGGVRTRDDAARLIDAGADRVSVNSAALATPDLLTRIANLYGSQAVVVAIDTADGDVFSHGGTQATGLEVVAWAQTATSAGAGEILLTSIRHDGQRQGYDLETTARVRAAVTVPVIASGGAGSVADVVAALRVTDAALVASIVHDDPAQLRALRDAIDFAGVALRPLAAVHS
jgi:imidazole glycerol-phosphate synthase subunit HisF